MSYNFLNNNDNKSYRVENYKINNSVIYTGNIISGKQHGYGIQKWGDGQNMKESGRMEKSLVIYFIIQKVIYIKDFGKMIKQLGMEFIFQLMELNMKGSGSMILKMDMEMKYRMLDVNIKEIIKKGKKMEKENIHGLMEVNILEIVKLTIKMFMVFIFGQIKKI